MSEPCGFNDHVWTGEERVERLVYVQCSECGCWWLRGGGSITADLAREVDEARIRTALTLLRLVESGKIRITKNTERFPMPILPKRLTQYLEAVEAAEKEGE